MDVDSINKDIGRRIRNLRNRNGLTQQELADRTELTKGFISQLERGQVSASVATLMDLIECLGTTPAEFFEDEEPQVVFTEKEYFEKLDEQGNSRQWIVPMAQKFQMEPEKVYHVKSGESFYYQASQKHRIENPGSRQARFIWISTPPEF